MKPWELLGATSALDGTDIRLVRIDDEYVMLANGRPLMSSRSHGSEEALAPLGCSEVRRLARPRILVGGLGMGFTLRAVLDVLPSAAVVTVAELVPAVIQWNREPLAALAGHPLAGLYDNTGVAAAYAALCPRGTFAIWSPGRTQNSNSVSALMDLPSKRCGCAPGGKTRAGRGTPSSSRTRTRASLTPAADVCGTGDDACRRVPCESPSRFGHAAQVSVEVRVQQRPLVRSTREAAPLDRERFLP